MNKNSKAVKLKSSNTPRKPWSKPKIKTTISAKNTKSGIKAKPPLENVGYRPS